MIRVGSRVVCLDDNGALELNKGRHYTITRIDKEFVHLDGPAGGWYRDRFKPVSTPVADPPKSGRLR